MITVAGMIGTGKTTLTTILAEDLGFKPLYEEVDDLPMLELFYTASDEEKEKYRYSFLLQLEFLNGRFAKLKEGLIKGNIVMDRSAYEDNHFTNVIHERGEISEVEHRIYTELFDNMMEEVEGLPKKAPDLLIYLKADFETVLERIGKRGRSFEQDEELIEYYYHLWKDYDHWVNNVYDKSDVIIIDANKYDFVNNQEDREEVVQMIKERYEEKEEELKL